MTSSGEPAGPGPADSSPPLSPLMIEDSGHDSDFSAFLNMLNNPSAPPKEDASVDTFRTNEGPGERDAPNKLPPGKQDSFFDDLPPEDKFDAVMDKQNQTMTTTDSSHSGTLGVKHADSAAVDTAAVTLSTDHDTINGANNVRNKGVGNVDGNGNNARLLSTESSEMATKETKTQRHMRLASVLLFVIGSILYLVMAVKDWQWAHVLLTLPMYVRVADDDATWTNYRLKERYNASLAEGAVQEAEEAEGEGELGVAAERSGGVRRMLGRKRSKGRHGDAHSINLREVFGEAASGIRKLTRSGERHEASVTLEREELAKAAEAKEGGEGGAVGATPEPSRRRLQTPEELYYDECWADLPPDIQAAFVVMGYTEDIWDNGGSAETDDMDWTELSDEQKEAALFIGYTEEMWCETPAPVAAPDGDGGGGGGGGGSEPVLTQPVATGSPTPKPVTESPTKHSSPKPITDSPTKQPSPKPVTNSPTEQPTSKPVTNSPTKEPTPKPVTDSPTARPSPKPVTDAPTKQPTPKPVTVTPSKRPTLPPIPPFLFTPTKPVEPAPPTTPPIPSFLPSMVLYWNQLSEGQKNSLSLLGFDQASWDSGGIAPAEFKAWSEMTSQEKFGAFFVGYDAAGWDDTPAGEKFDFKPPESEDDGADNNIFEGDAVVPAPVSESPTARPSPAPTTGTPTARPSTSPVTAAPTPNPTAEPTVKPTGEPTSEPSKGPSKTPSLAPTSTPTRSPVTMAPTTSSPVPAVPIILSPTNPMPDSPTAPGANPQVPSTPTPEELYYDEWWKDLPPEIQNAYSKLGHDETKWNQGLPAETDDYDWEELSAEQQEAALFIGYTEELWCWTAMPTGAPTSSGKPTVAVPDIPSGPTPEELYYGEYWKDLPRDIQSAFAVLGYEEASWNNGIEPPSNELGWHELTDDQRMAALLIGYTQHLWDLADDAPSAAPSEPAVPPGYYDDYDWSELPPEIQEAAAALGYDQTVWDASGVAWSEDYDWDELKPEAQQAAALLGYDKASWDTEEAPAVGDIVEDSLSEIATPAVQPGYYDDYDWTELPPEVQVAAAALGYNQTLWDASGVAWSEDYDWDELEPSAQQAAALLGYDKASWDAEEAPAAEDSLSAMTPTVPPDYYDDYDWDELPPEVQGAAETLGYDQQLWDISGVAWSENEDWDDLPPEAQRAAVVLGYDEYSWDGVDPVTGAALAATDDYVSYDDDYVFRVGPAEADIWVSQYQILYFFAASSFLLLGVLDLIRERRAFHLLMILAGFFGVISSIYVEVNIRLSDQLNCVSVNFFLLESITLFGSHKRSAVSVDVGKWMRRSILFGDAEFILGALLDVIISYFYLFDDTSDWDLALQGTSIFAAVLWLHCSLIYMAAFVYEHQVLENDALPR